MKISFMTAVRWMSQALPVRCERSPRLSPARGVRDAQTRLADLGEELVGERTESSAPRSGKSASSPDPAA